LLQRYLILIELHLTFYFSSWEVDEFEETVDMSSYLVAFIVSNHKNITKTSSREVQIEVFAKPESIDRNDGDHALDEAAEIIDFFSEYFDIDYPLKKSSIYLKLNTFFLFKHFKNNSH